MDFFLNGLSKQFFLFYTIEDRAYFKTYFYERKSKGWMKRKQKPLEFKWNQSLRKM
jgi:hypothetical protein